jgi:pheromone shutdown protein TraB
MVWHVYHWTSSLLWHAQIVGPLLHERDMYLAWSLKRSKAVNGTRRVVGVVGRGHLRGVLYHLVTPDSSGLRFSDLVGGRNVLQNRRREAGRLAGRLALEAGLAVAGYLAWEQLFP